MTVASKLLMGAAGVDTGPSDDEFDNVSFLSHFDGSNNGTNIVYDDGSVSNHTITVVGTPSQGTFSPFSRVDGEWSNYFDGSSDYATVPASSDFDFDTGDFTIELWAMRSSTNNGGFFQFSSSALNSQSGAGPGLGVYSGGLYLYYGKEGALQGTDLGGTLPGVGTWFHVAYVRASGVIQIYVDGTAYGSTTASTVDYTGPILTLGGWYTSSFLFPGYISNFRIVKGTAVYTGNFTPSTSALTAISGTVLLTCQSNRFIDNSATGHVLTVAGSPEVTAFTPILTSKAYDSAVNGASAHCDGSGDYLTVATSLTFNLGTADFTLSAWLYSSNDNTFGVLGDMNVSGATDSWSIWWNHSAGEFRLGTDDLANMAGWAVTLNLNSWNNVVVTRASAAIKFFFNGVEITSRATDTGNIDGATFPAPTPVYIGSFNSGDGRLNGYVTDVRIIKGTAVNPSGQPTAPLTAVTNTSLLLNMADGQALDSAAQNNMELYADADTSTTQQKFGTASLALDGTGDYLDIPANPAFAFGTGDFTVEVFIKTATSSGDVYNRRIYLTDGPTGNADNNIQLAINPVGGVAQVWSNSGSINLNSTTSVTDDAWHHIAMVRSSGTVSLYVDGTSEGTPTSYTENINLNSGSPRPRIGNYSGSGATGSFNGYIDEVRVSRVARYTSNFTAPTEPFPDKGQ